MSSHKPLGTFLLELQPREVQKAGGLSDSGGAGYQNLNFSVEPQPKHLCNIGAFIIRIGFWGPIYCIIIVRNPQNSAQYTIIIVRNPQDSSLKGGQSTNFGNPSVGQAAGKLQAELQETSAKAQLAGLMALECPWELVSVFVAIRTPKEY